jgi:alpha-maltose-1-phosphate synthase
VLRTYPAVAPERVEVVHNGIDPDEYCPDHGTETLGRFGIDPDVPMVLFVGRNTRQKGIMHLLQAAHWIDPGAQLVLVAGAPDTEEIGREVAEAVERVGRTRERLLWIEKTLVRDELVQLFTHATVFVCPSIYEPLGIVNLEAMACETPVVATRTGGIPEVVVDGVTGYLVPFEPVDDASSEPRDPERFAEDIARLVNAVLDDPARAGEMGVAARQRVLERFTWAAIAERTLTLYQRTLEKVALRVAEATRGS